VLEVTDHTLTIKGERLAETEEKRKSYYLHERLEKRFERRFTLPPEVDTEHIDATFRTGVLEVHVPKIEPLKARTIEITG
jgi:HSP20 family protein